MANARNSQLMNDLKARASELRSTRIALHQADTREQNTRAKAGLFCYQLTYDLIILITFQLARRRKARAHCSTKIRTCNRIKA